MKILIWSNAPHELTGYGRQVRELAPRLQALGHEVACAAMGGLIGGSIVWNGITVYPTRYHPLGADTIGFYARHFGADVILSLYDIWALPADVRKSMPCPWIALVPVDGEPISDRMKRRLDTVDYVVSISHFGQVQLEIAGYKTDYIPLGIDCDVFTPGDKAEARAALGFGQDAFLITVVAANKGYPARKSWLEILEAFRHFNNEHNEARLYCHTTPMPLVGKANGIPLHEAMKMIEVDPETVIFPDQGELAIGIPDDQMCLIYRASDVLLSPSMGEGFGLPIVEAQACGIPVITQRCSAMTEHTWFGSCIEPLRDVYIPQLGYFWSQADEVQIVDALELLGWNYGGEGAKYHAKKAADRIRKAYHWPNVIREYWQPFLEKAESELW